MCARGPRAALRLMETLAPEALRRAAGGEILHGTSLRQVMIPED